MQPYFEIDEHTHHIITELINKCTELDIGNISFSYYMENINFLLTGTTEHWTLIVTQEKTRQDVYTITGGTFKYLYSE